MVKTISAVFREGVFVPLVPVDNIAEETSLEINLYLPFSDDFESPDSSDDTLEEDLQLLYETAGMLGSDLPADEVRYIIESPELAQENLYFNVGEA